MVKEVTESNFKTEVLDQDSPVLVDFWAPWCGPCQMLKPILDTVENQIGNKVIFAKVNTDENQDLAGRYRITGIPCLILYKDGREIDRYVGVQPAAVLESNLRRHID